MGDEAPLTTTTISPDQSSTTPANIMDGGELTPITSGFDSLVYGDCYGFLFSLAIFLNLLSIVMPLIRRSFKGTEEYLGSAMKKFSLKNKLSEDTEEIQELPMLM